MVSSTDFVAAVRSAKQLNILEDIMKLYQSINSVSCSFNEIGLFRLNFTQKMLMLVRNETRKLFQYWITVIIPSLSLSYWVWGMQSCLWNITRSYIMLCAVISCASETKAALPHEQLSEESEKRRAHWDFQRSPSRAGSTAAAPPDVEQRNPASF